MSDTKRALLTSLLAFGACQVVCALWMIHAVLERIHTTLCVLAEDQRRLGAPRG